MMVMLEPIRISTPVVRLLVTPGLVACIDIASWHRIANVTTGRVIMMFPGLDLRVILKSLNVNSKPYTVPVFGFRLWQFVTGNLKTILILNPEK
jgi:hypothetical protein